jgi:drug/metabolite transporter (DMT)-like permease
MLPITAAAIGVLVLGEQWTGLQAVAFFVALTGLVLATLPTRGPHTDPTHKNSP